MDDLTKISLDPRVTVRRAGPPDPAGDCVVYWMQRAQRGIDNPALDAAVEAANVLRKPVVVFLAPVPFYPNANLRHYRFLGGRAFPIFRRRWRNETLDSCFGVFPITACCEFCEEVKAALVSRRRESDARARGMATHATKKLKVPFWTVDADVIVPSKLLEKAQYAAHIIRPRLQAQLKKFLIASRNPRAQVTGRSLMASVSLNPDFDITQGWRLDRSVSPVSQWRGGTREALRLLKEFVQHKLRGYGTQRNKPENDHTSRSVAVSALRTHQSVSVALAVEKARRAEGRQGSLS